MIAVKIALTFKENKDLIEINSKIKDNLIGFDDSTNEEKKKMTYLENKYLNYMENS